MADFKYFELRNITIGGKPVGWDTEEKTLHIVGEVWQVPAWLKVVDEINRLLKHYQPEPAVSTSTPRARSSSFLTHNVAAIHEQKRGRIKRAPWFLRPFFDSIITKEELNDR